MKHVTIIHGPYDESGEMDTEQGFLVADSYTMYVSDKYGQLWLDHVKPVPGRIDTFEAVRGIVLAEDFTGSAEAIADIYRWLEGMTAFQFIVNVLIPAGIDIDLFPE